MNGLPSNGICASSIGSMRISRSSSADRCRAALGDEGVKRLIDRQGVDMVVATSAIVAAIGNGTLRASRRSW